jgi:hypothetical protein
MRQGCERGSVVIRMWARSRRRSGLRFDTAGWIRRPPPRIESAHAEEAALPEGVGVESGRAPFP